MRQEDSTRGIMFGLVTSDDDGASAVAGIDKAMAIKKNSFAADLAELAGKIQHGGGPSKPVSELAALIADDSHFARKRIEKALRAMGFANITVAKDGAEAVEKIEASAFDMIVTDFNMPNLTGEAVTRKVRLDARNSKTPVLMFTSETEDHILQSAWQAGVDKILPKNATEEDVQSSVRQLLGLR
jgi:CheY-like chemotaxis protein